MGSTSQRLADLQATRAVARPGAIVTPMIVGGFRQTDEIAKNPPSIFKKKD